MEPTIPARFDWLSISADYEPGELVGDLSQRLSLEPRNTRALNGYQRAVGLFRGEEIACRVQWSDEGRPNVLATGFPSQLVYEVVRERFPKYSVARADVALDFEEADWFEVAHTAMRRLSHERGIKHHIRGDWETPNSPDGRTTYSGALGKSTIVRRLYEFRKCHGYGLPVRYEVEIKPQSKHKHRYCGIGPIEMLQMDGYSVELLRRLGFAIERLRVTNQSPKVLQNAWFQHLM